MKFIVYFLILFIAFGANAQSVVLHFDPVKNQVNEGSLLPAEKQIAIKGNAPSILEALHIDITTPNGKILQTTSWRKPVGIEVTNFEASFPFPLRSNEEYSINFLFYRLATKSEISSVQTQLNENIAAYLNAITAIKGNGVKLLKDPASMHLDLDNLVKDGLQFYAGNFNTSFPGFTDLVGLKLKQLAELRLKRARINIFAPKNASNDSVRLLYFQQNLAEVQALLNAELEQYFHNGMLLVYDKREVKGLKTERTKTYLPINIGYGAIYFGGNSDNLNLGGAPFAGLSIPLGNRTFNKFWGNTSISTGLFLQKIKDNNDVSYSGPIVGVPVYVGLGYRFLQYFRFNAGTVILTSENIGLDNIKATDINLRPFIGLSFEFNLWLGLGGKK